MNRLQKLTLSIIGVVILIITSLVFNSGTRVEAAELPYGKNTLCYLPDGATLQEEAVCQTIPTTNGWGKATIPTPTAPQLTNLNVTSAGTGFIEHVVSEGGLVGSPGEDASVNQKSFYVHPADQTKLPLIGEHNLEFFGHNGTIRSIQAIGVALPVPDDVNDGSTSQIVEAGSAFSINLTPNDDGTYTQNIAVPSPTFTRSTAGTVNEIGYAFGVYYTVELDMPGQGIVTVQLTRGYLARSGYFADLQEFKYEECGSDLCAGGGSYALDISELDVTPTAPVLPEQPATPEQPEQPSSPEPPVSVDTPASPTTPDTPADADYPRVNTDGVGFNLGFGFLGAALLFATLTFCIFVARRRSEV